MGTAREDRLSVPTAVACGLLHVREQLEQLRWMMEGNHGSSSLQVRKAWVDHCRMEQNEALRHHFLFHGARKSGVHGAQSTEAGRTAVTEHASFIETTHKVIMEGGERWAGFENLQGRPGCTSTHQSPSTFIHRATNTHIAPKQGSISPAQNRYHLCSDSEGLEGLRWLPSSLVNCIREWGPSLHRSRVTSAHQTRSLHQGLLRPHPHAAACKFITVLPVLGLEVGWWWYQDGPDATCSSSQSACGRESDSLNRHRLSHN